MKVFFVSLAVGVIATILTSTLSAHYISFDESTGKQIEMVGLQATRHYLGQYGVLDYLYSLRVSFLINTTICFVSAFISIKLVARKPR